MKGAKQSADINAYKSLYDLQIALDEAEKVKDRKEQEKIHKAKMREDADRIYQDKTTLVVRPQSEGASCYYGQGTKWCISATDSQNYLEQIHRGRWSNLLLHPRQRNCQESRRRQSQLRLPLRKCRQDCLCIQRRSFRCRTSVGRLRRS